MDASEYYKVRLEHTLQHTQQSTKLIYLVNGGILALLYFVARLPSWPYQQALMAFVVEALAIINLIHAALIVRQGKLYSTIDNAIAGSIVDKPTIIRPRGFPWMGTHTLYAVIHSLLAAGLFVAGLCIFSIPDVLPKAPLSASPHGNIPLRANHGEG